MPWRYSRGSGHDVEGQPGDSAAYYYAYCLFAGQADVARWGLVVHAIDAGKQVDDVVVAFGRFVEDQEGPGGGVGDINARGGEGSAFTRYTTLRDITKDGNAVLLQDLNTGENLVGVVEDIHFAGINPPDKKSPFSGKFYATIRTV